MAAAVIIEVPLLQVAKLRLGDFGGASFAEQDYTSRLMAGMDTNTATAYLQGVGGGYYQWRPKAGTDDETLITGVDFTGAADHFYLVHPRGTMRALTAIKTASTTTANADASANLATVLTNSSGAFTSATTVAVGDIIIMALTGATAEVVTVDSATQLTTTPLSYGGEYTTGQSYYIGRAPGTDTTANYSVTARQWDGRAVFLNIFRQWQTYLALQSGGSVGSATGDADPRYSRVAREIDLLVGIESA